MIATQGLLAFAACLVILLVVVAIAVRGVKAYHAPAMIGTRPDQRIPKTERDLLGDDWTDHVAGFASVQHDRDETIAHIVNGDDEE